ncbi:unnamed protein product, partial [Ectocarpus sp. 8 AP-2014]
MEGKEKNKENQPIMDDRNPKLKLVVEAVRAMKQGGAIDEKTMRMFEKDDCRLYRITVRDLNRRDDGTTVDGTVVTLDGKKWIVVSERRDGEGYKEFKLEAADKSRKDKGTVRWCTIFELPEHADDPGVVGQGEERKRVNLVICDMLCTAYVPVYKFIQGDPTIKREKKEVELSEEDGTEALGIAAAADLINAHELALLGSDKDLQTELKKAKSLFGFLRLDRFELVAYSGLMDKKMDFHKDHIRGAQSAYRLGRAVCMESCLAPLSAGGGHTELPPGVKLEHASNAPMGTHVRTRSATTAG